MYFCPNLHHKENFSSLKADSKQCSTAGGVDTGSRAAAESWYIARVTFKARADVDVVLPTIGKKD